MISIQVNTFRVLQFTEGLDIGQDRPCSELRLSHFTAGMHTAPQDHCTTLQDHCTALQDHCTADPMLTVG